MPYIGSRGNSFYHKAATASVWFLLYPFVVQFIEMAGVQGTMQNGDVETARMLALVFAVIIAVGMLIGVALGVIALFGISEYGKKGIMVKALFGILVPIALFLISIPVLLHAQERARQHQQAQQFSNP